MTDKKQNILNVALELFANEGYAASSTSKIAKKAGVSEGLIFRHFGNKHGLLTALNTEAEELSTRLFAPILFETHPKKVIRKTIKLPFKSMGKREQDLLKLQFLLQWQPDYSHPGKMRPLTDKLTAAFTELKYKEPEKEARLLNHVIHDIFSESIKGNFGQPASFKKFILKKYNV